MKKKKNTKHKDNPAVNIKFETAQSQTEFTRLMQPLEVKQIKSSPQKNREPLEPIVFDEKARLDPTPDLLINKDKFQGHGQKPPKKRQRKLKISPGFVPDSVLDLHGYTKAEAQQRVELFLQQSIHKKRKVVLIITGRGLNSTIDGGILKKSVWIWLEFNQIQLNLRFRWAPPFLGGNGAILVFF